MARSGLDPETYKSGGLFYENVLFNLIGGAGRLARVALDSDADWDHLVEMYGGEKHADMYTLELLEEAAVAVHAAGKILSEAIDVAKTRGRPMNADSTYEQHVREVVAHCARCKYPLTRYNQVRLADTGQPICNHEPNCRARRGEQDVAAHAAVLVAELDLTYGALTIRQQVALDRLRNAINKAIQ